MLYSVLMEILPLTPNLPTQPDRTYNWGKQLELGSPISHRDYKQGKKVLSTRTVKLYQSERQSPCVCHAGGHLETSKKERSELWVNKSV